MLICAPTPFTLKTGGKMYDSAPLENNQFKAYTNVYLMCSHNYKGFSTAHEIRFRLALVSNVLTPPACPLQKGGAIFEERGEPQFHAVFSSPCDKRLFVLVLSAAAPRKDERW